MNFKGYILIPEKTIPFVKVGSVVDLVTVICKSSEVVGKSTQITITAHNQYNWADPISLKGIKCDRYYKVLKLGSSTEVAKTIADQTYLSKRIDFYNEACVPVFKANVFGDWFPEPDPKTDHTICGVGIGGLLNYTEKNPAGGTKRTLYHATTPSKAKKYGECKAIHSPVRGFTTLQGAMAWALKVNRTVIYEIECEHAHKLPDHHNKFGEAWWNDGNVTKFKCVFSADSDA